MNTNITRRQFAQSHSIIAMLFAYICGVKLKAEESDNFGFMIDRTRWNDDQGLCEKIIAQEWANANQVKYNQGILQTLMFQAAQREGKDFDPIVSPRERKIVAMVIQWLTTDCGRSFLNEASIKMGERHRCYPFWNNNYKA